MRARKVDANQAAIVAGLRALPGVSVLILNAEADLLVGRASRNYLLEVKNPARYWRTCDKRTVDEQVRFRTAWRGQLAVVTTLDEALLVIGAVDVRPQEAAPTAAESCA